MTNSSQECLSWMWAARKRPGKILGDFNCPCCAVSRGPHFPRPRPLLNSLKPFWCSKNALALGCGGLGRRDQLNSSLTHPTDVLAREALLSQGLQAISELSCA